MKRVIMGIVLGIAGLIGAAGTAAACTYSCEVVSPNCRRCLDLNPIWTGATCQDTGSCGCRYTNYCEGSAAPQLSFAPVAEPTSCSSETASDELVLVAQ